MAIPFGDTAMLILTGDYRRLLYRSRIRSGDEPKGVADSGTVVHEAPISVRFQNIYDHELGPGSGLAHHDVADVKG